MSDPMLSHRIERWLDDGPDMMPDRVIGEVARRIATERQRPAWRRRYDRRLDTMSTATRLAAAAAAILVVILGSTLFVAGGAAPAPSPTAAPVPSGSPLTYTWPGPLGGGTYRTTFAWDLPFQIELTVPPGWSGYDIEVSRTDRPEQSVEFVLVANLFADPCRTVPLDPPVGPGARDLASALTHLPGLDVGPQAPVELDRQARGWAMDYTRSADAACGPADFVLWDLAADRFRPGVPIGDPRKPLVASAGRIWVLDVSGQRLVMRTTWDPAATPAELEVLRRIAASVAIVRPDASPPPQPSTP